MAVHVGLKNEFMEDEKCLNLMTCLKLILFCVTFIGTLPAHNTGVTPILWLVFFVGTFVRPDTTTFCGIWPVFIVFANMNFYQKWKKNERKSIQVLPGWTTS